MTRARKTATDPANRSARTRSPDKPSSKSLKLDPASLSELFKPARLEVYETLQIAGPSTIAELARRLCRPADSLYYHVKKLLAIGVVEELDGAEASEVAAPSEVPARGRRAAVYVATRRPLGVELDPQSTESREAWSDGGAAVLRLVQRDFAAALEERVDGQREPCSSGGRRNIALRRIKLRLDDEQLAEVNTHLDALHALLQSHTENTTGELHAITTVLTPLEERTER